jgi:pyruvate formate lyase activating enzyme
VRPVSEPLTGRILHLQRLSTEDGPGIRTTVFFKGCPLACRWCHNPESIRPEPQVQWLEQRCIGCQRCLDVCPHGALTMTPAGIERDWQRCTGCGQCVEACPANAMELLGTTISVPDLVNEVAKDATYFGTSGGGVTASGGEPTLQAPFVAEFFARLHQLNIATALDTCGLTSQRAMALILPHTDLLLFDLKEIDPEKHRSFTRQSNEKILAMLLTARGMIQEQGLATRIWIRTPLIPQATATTANLSGIGAFLARNLDGAIDRWELCAFNNLCRDKYRRLGMEWDYAETSLLSAGELAALEETARLSGVNPSLVAATGATQSEQSTT